VDNLSNRSKACSEGYKLEHARRELGGPTALAAECVVFAEVYDAGKMTRGEDMLAESKAMPEYTSPALQRQNNMVGKPTLHRLTAPSHKHVRRTGPQIAVRYQNRNCSKQHHHGFVVIAAFVAQGSRFNSVSDEAHAAIKVVGGRVGGHDMKMDLVYAPPGMRRCEGTTYMPQSTPR